MKKYLVICLLLPTMSMAQSKADIVKFEIIRSTVDFYVTDTAFKPVFRLPSNCNTNDYPCLDQFCRNNNLTGVPDRISKWRNIKVNNKASVIAFKDSIVKDVTAREHRKALASFINYTSELDDLIDSYKEDAHVSVVVPPAPKTPDTGIAKQQEDKTRTEAKEARRSTNWLLWVALLTSLGGLGLGLWVFLKKSKVKVGQVEMATANDLEQLKRSLATLTTQLSQKADTATTQTINDRLDTVESWIKKASQQPTTANTATEATKSNKPVPPVPTTTKLYAKLPDMDGGNGFSNNILRTEQLGEQAYEITIGETTGSYTISKDKGAQAYAINDFNHILGRGCTINNLPSANCRVETLQTGTLSKSKDGWMIDSKAVVEFR